MTFVTILYRLAQLINGLALLCLSGLLYVWPQQRIFLSQPSLEKFVEVNFALVIVVLFVLIGSSTAWLYYQRRYLVDRPKRWFHFIIPFLTSGFSGSIVWNSYIFHSKTVEKFNDVELVRNKTWSLVLEPTYSQKIQILNDWYTALQKDQILLPNWSQQPSLDFLVTQIQHKDYVISYIYEQSLLSGTPVVLPAKETWGMWCHNHPYITTAVVVTTVVTVGVIVFLAFQSFENAKKAGEATAQALASAKADKILDEIKADAIADAAEKAANATRKAAQLIGNAEEQAAVILANSKLEAAERAVNASRKAANLVATARRSSTEIVTVATRKGDRILALAQEEANKLLDKQIDTLVSTAAVTTDTLIKNAGSTITTVAQTVPQPQVDAVVSTVVEQTLQAVASVTPEPKTLLQTISDWWRPELLGDLKAKVLSNEAVAKKFVADHPRVWKSIANEPELPFVDKLAAFWADKASWAYSRMCSYYTYYGVETSNKDGINVSDAIPLIMDAAKFKENIQIVDKWSQAVDKLPYTDQDKYIVPRIYNIILACKEFVSTCLGL